MRKSILLLAALAAVTTLRAQTFDQWFPPADLIETGVYYYPEHWDESQWARDLDNIKALGFDFVHYGEFAWAQLEPRRGEYDFGWLDRAVALAAERGLKIVLCTSTATPPVWLVREYPEIPILGEDGTRKAHGSREHPSFSSTVYREYALTMIRALAERYGDHPAVMGWQLDNEPNVSYDYNPDAQERFRRWVRARYRDDIDELNRTWGTAFWSQTYNDFEQIEIPRMSQQFMNNHQTLDYRRFAVEETVSFLDEQAAVLKARVSPRQWVTTNVVPDYADGQLRGGRNLDFHVYTRYMVHGEQVGIGRKGYRVGYIERIALANDFFRPIDGLYGVMELQPGQVNWGAINPQPAPGAVRLWMWHVFAGGSRFICTYRYRNPLFGTELYHYGIVGPDGVTVTPGGREYERFIREIDALRTHYNPDAAPNAAYEARRTAILYNHENTWEMQRNRQTRLWDSEAHLRKYYDPLKRFGAPVDVIDERADFTPYRVMIAPAYQQVDPELVARWRAYVEQGGNLVLSARTGHKTRMGQLPEMPFGGMTADLIGAGIDFYDLLMPDTPDTVRFEGRPYSWVTWGEILSPHEGTEVWGTYEGDYYAGRPGVVFRRLGRGTVTYVGVDSQDGELEADVLRKLYGLLGIGLENLPEGVHIEYRDGFGIAVNYSDTPQRLPLPAGTRYLVGSGEIPTAGVAVFTY